MKQEKALAFLKSGHNVFLTGSAGAGKTYVLNEYIKYLKERKMNVAVTASTGIAATHLQGQTIHSWCGMGIKESISSSQLHDLAEKSYIKKNLENVSVLIIDEISMLHRRQLEMVDEILRFFRDGSKPFGGIQVVFSGDFFQLPPVSKEEDEDKEKFCFMSSSWVDSGLQICYLDEQHRQSEGRFHEILNAIRNRNMGADQIAELEESMYNNLKIATKLYTHNADVDRINLEHLEELSTDLFSFDAETKGNPNMVELLKKSVLAPEVLQIKIGAKVMMVRNNFEKGYSNGSLGFVDDIREEENGDLYPVIQLLNGRRIKLEKEKWSIEDDSGKSLVSFSQYPIRLAWAITVHKSQGMTLDEAEVDLSKSFETGQGYVALSRVKSLEGLKLIGYNDNSFEVNNLAYLADKRFQELSEMADSQYDKSYLESFHEQFLRSNGGITDPVEIKRHLQKKEAKKRKISTYMLTKKLLDKGKSIEEIAEERGLTSGTIYNHIRKLADDFPEIDLSNLEANEDVKREVYKAIEELEKNSENLLERGDLRLSSLYFHLNEKYSYDELRMILWFREREKSTLTDKGL